MKINSSVSENLVNHFLLAKDLKYSPDGWGLFPLNDWILSVHESLPVTVINDISNKFSGVILGYPILSGVLITTIYSCNSMQYGDMDVFVENEIYSKISGRYIAIVLNGGEERLYLDPTGSLAAIYSTEESIVAASSSLLGKDKNSLDFNDIQNNISRHIYFGITRHDTIKRVIPNHYLDLVKWNLKRHYPTDQSFTGLVNVERSVATIAHEISNMVNAFLPHGLYMSLTAGADARMILACCKAYINNMVFIQNAHLGEDELDKYMSDKLIDAMRLKSVNLDGVREISVEERNIFNLILGCMPILFTNLPKSVCKIKQKSFHFTGVSGEIGRGSLYNQTDFDNNQNITIEEIFKRTGIPLNNLFLSHAEPILSPLINKFNKFQILDLFFIEQVAGCVSGPNTYPFDSFALTSIHGFNSRTAISSMISLDPLYKFKQNLVRDICNLRWPELNSFPINKYEF